MHTLWKPGNKYRKISKEKKYGIKLDCDVGERQHTKLQINTLKAKIETKIAYTDQKKYSRSNGIRLNGVAHENQQIVFRRNP